MGTLRMTNRMEKEKINRNEIETRVIELVKAEYDRMAPGGELSGIELSTNIRKDLGFDSIMLVVLQVDIEDAFKIRFNPLEYDLQSVFTTVGVICDYVQGQMERRIYEL